MHFLNSSLFTDEEILKFKEQIESSVSEARTVNDGEQNYGKITCTHRDVNDL